MRRSLRSLVPLCAALMVLAVGPPPATAEGPDHPLLSTLRVRPPIAPSLKDACGVAVDAKGYAYVADYYQHAIYVFSDSGEYVTQFANVDPLDGSNKESLDGPCDLAFDSAGDLYVNNWHRDVVKYTPSFPGSTIYTAGPVIDANHPTSVAVDPVTDRVYADDGTYVAEYEPSGAQVPVQIGLGSLGDGYGVAVSRFGTPEERPYVYVADAADETVKVYDPSVSTTIPVSTINGAGTPRGAFYLADADLAVDPSDGHLFVSDNLQPGFEHPELAVDEFSAAGHYRGRLPYASLEGSETRLVDARLSAVAVANGEIFVTSGNDFVTNSEYDEAEVLVFGPAPPVPTQILTVEKTGTGSGTVGRVPSGWLWCGVACEGEFDQGAPVELAATPDPHNRFVGWSGGCEAEPSPSECFLRMDADTVVGAEFEPIPQQGLSVAKTGAGAGVVTSSPAGIDCGSACEGEFDAGSTAMLTASAAAGSRLAAWSGCDSEPTPDTCTVTMSSARSVTAEFEPIPSPPPPPSSPVQHTLAIFSTGAGTATGTVDSAPAGIDCGGVCMHAYADGAIVALVAHPADGASFLGWGGCDSAGGDRCTVALGADRTVVAAFGPGSPGRLRLRRLDVSGAAATLEAVVPAPGALSASGKYLRLASSLPLADGPVALHLQLTRSGLRALQGARSGRLAVKVALAFAPFDGGPAVDATKTVTFRARQSGG